MDVSDKDLRAYLKHRAYAVNDGIDAIMTRVGQPDFSHIEEGPALTAKLHELLVEKKLIEGLTNEEATT